MKRRDYKIKEWLSVGNADSLSDAARRIGKMENEVYPTYFFRFYVDPFTELTGKTDAELMSRIEYQGEKHFYLLTRSVQ